LNGPGPAPGIARLPAVYFSAGRASGLTRTPEPFPFY